MDGEGTVGAEQISGTAGDKAGSREENSDKTEAWTKEIENKTAFL